LGGIAAPLAGALLGWSEQSRRDLPWRRTRDPWAVLVSELMLQQTQVARVVRIYPGFMARFPDPASCARAPAGAVIEAWSGLGYNRRALNLHRIATTVVDRHGGQLPDTIEGLMALPGVGPYTARAVSVFAFEAECGVVDTNAWRVLARAVAGSRLSGRDAQALADELVPPGRARPRGHRVRQRQAPLRGLSRGPALSLAHRGRPGSGRGVVAAPAGL
jgi:A/G-specific adenine glycosylase